MMALGLAATTCILAPSLFQTIPPDRSPFILSCEDEARSRSIFDIMLRLERQPKRNTVLYDGERELGRLTYPKWYSSRAEILLPDGVYELVPKGFWSTGLTASYQGIPVMNVRFLWKGGGKIERPGQPERMLTYKMSSFWKSQYVVTDMQGRERMIHRAKASWKYMDSNHEIEKMGEPPLEPLEILMLVHAINVSNRRAGAAAAT